MVGVRARHRPRGGRICSCAGWLRIAISGGVLLSALGFSSAWLAGGYRAGAAVLAALAVATVILLVRGLHRQRIDPAVLLWGLGATLVGGGVQAFSVLGGGLEVSQLAVFAFPLGSLVQAAFWPLALSVRLREQRRSWRTPIACTSKTRCRNAPRSSPPRWLRPRRRKRCQARSSPT